MDSEAREHALLRRIEELAQAADDQPAADARVVSAALAGLRVELGGLRAEMGSLRSDLTAARTGVDSNGSRLGAALADARAETEELGRRHDQLAGRVDDIADAVADVRSLLVELRNTIADQPDSVAAVSASVARVDENLGAKVDTLADDLRRTLHAGMTQATAGNRATETALTETRSVLEERLAIVEDTLDGLADRLESMARDSVSANEEHLRRIEAKVDQVTATALPEAVEAQEQWAVEIRAALGELAAAVDRSLGSLGTSLHDAVRETREDERAHVEDLVAQLDRRLALVRDTTSASTAELRGFLEAFQEVTNARLEEVRSALAGGLQTAREELVARLQGSLDGLEAANGESRQLVEEEVSSLRADLADALEEVRDRIAATVQVAQMGIVNAVEDQRTSFDEIVRTLRADVLDRVEESTATVRTGLDDLRSGVTTAARAGEESQRRLAQFTETLEQVDAAVTEMRADWDRRTDVAIDMAAQAGHAAVDEFRAEVRDVIDDLRRSVDASAGSVDESVDLVGTATSRLVAAGQALLGYLVRRDQLLEQERDRALHEVLDEFAQGLSAKERRGLADRVGEALDRRRDARDAERYRRTAAGEPMPEPPEVPEDLAALAEPVRPPRSEIAASLPPLPRVTSKQRPAKKAAAKKAAVEEETAPEPVEVEPFEPVAPEEPAPAKTTARKRAPAKKTAAKKTVSKQTSARKRTAPRKRAAVEVVPDPEPADLPKVAPEVTAAEEPSSSDNAVQPVENATQSSPLDDVHGDPDTESAASITEPLDEIGTTRV